jgi:hypothetical protein
MKWRPFRFTRTRRPARKPVRRVVPVLEVLESRLTPSATNVLTYHNDNSSTGDNLNETALTPGNVNPSTFGKQFSTGVDGQVYAQPLYMANVNITTGSNQGTHNVAFVATENDSVYAIDADSGAVLWQDSLLHAVHGGTVTPVPSSDVNSGDLSPQIGITSTPVIDPNTNLMYVEAKTKEVAGDGSHYIHQLYAINVADGSYAENSPVVIADSIGDTYVSGPTDHGTGAGSKNGTVYFDALRQLNRPGLTEANGNVYLGFASHGDNGPYHGWVLSYNASTLKLNGVFDTTPNGTEGGIWQAGGRLDVDAKGNLYFETGNGTFDTQRNALGMPIHGDYGDSFVKLTVDPYTSPTRQGPNGWGLEATDYFTPYDQANLNGGDLDLGSGGPLLLPDSVGSSTHPQLMVGSGKEGRIYLIDRNNMGKFDPRTDHVVQETNNTTITGSFDTPAYYNNTIYYVGGSNIGNPNDVGKTFSISNGQMSLTPTSQGPDAYGYPGSTPSVSANGSTNGIVWDLDTGTNQLRAYNASGYNNELYTSGQAANNRDAMVGSVIKFSVPTVANGKVYVGSSNSLVVYGLFNQIGAPQPAPPEPAGHSAPPATGPSGASAGLTATAVSGTEVDLQWGAAGSNQTPYVVLRSTDASFRDTVAALTAPGATTYVDTALIPGTTYYYRVAPADNPGNYLSASQTTPTLPAAVTNLQVAGNTGHEVDLSWTDNADNATHIEVWRQKGANSPILIADLPATATSLRDTGLVAPLVPGVEYTYDVHAMNLAGPSLVASVSLTAGASSGDGAASAAPAPVNGSPALAPARAGGTGSAGAFTSVVQVGVPTLAVTAAGGNSTVAGSGVAPVNASPADPHPADPFNAALGYDGTETGLRPRGRR